MEAIATNGNCGRAINLGQCKLYNAIRSIYNVANWATDSLFGGYLWLHRSAVRFLSQKDLISLPVANGGDKYKHLNGNRKSNCDAEILILIARQQRKISGHRMCVMMVNKSNGELPGILQTVCGGSDCLPDSSALCSSAVWLFAAFLSWPIPLDGCQQISATSAKAKS